MIRLTLQNLLGRKGRLFSTSIAILLAVAFGVGTLVFTDTIRRTFEDLFADVTDGTDAYVQSASVEEAFGITIRDRIDESLLDPVSAVEGVAAAEGFLQGTARMIGPDGEPIGLAANGPPSLGLSWGGQEQFNPWTLDEGSRAPFGPGEVVIDRASATSADISIGDLISVLTTSSPAEFTVVGIAGFGNSDSPGGATVALFDLPTAQELFSQPGRLDGINVAAIDGVDQEELTTRISVALATAGSGEVEVLTGEELAEDNQSQIEQGLGFISTFLLTFAGVGVFVAAFIIYNTFAIVVTQRNKETAMLRAIGASRRQVIVGVLIEAVVVGIIASVLGIVAGVGLAIGLREMLSLLGVSIPADGLVLAPRTILVGLATGMVVTIVSAVGPALKASRTSPLEAMRDSATDLSGRSKKRMVIGAVMVIASGIATAIGVNEGEVSAAGLGVLGLFLGSFVLGPVITPRFITLMTLPFKKLRGITGDLATENTLRNPKRTANAASALTIGVALVGAITVMAASVKDSVRDSVDDQFIGAITVDSGAFGFGGLSPALTEELSAIDGIEQATGIRFAVGSVEGNGDAFTAVDPATALDLFDIGISDGDARSLDGDSILVFADKADELGIGVGDEMTVELPGLGSTELEVAALYEENALVGNYAIAHELWESTGTEQFDISTFLTLDDGLTVEDVRASVEEVAATHPGATVSDREEYIDSQTAQIDGIVNLMYGLLGLAVIIAGLGIANTLRLSVLERTRELGLLRAVGMSRRQTKRMIRWESVMISVLGAIQGVLIGVFFGWVLIRALSSQGLTTFTVPFGALSIIVAGAALLGVVAAARPARKAAKLDVLASISSF